MIDDFWNSGQTIVIRHVWRDEVRFAEPALVVEDGPDRTIVFMPMGTTTQRSMIDFGSGEIPPVEPRVWHTTSVLRILEPEVGYAITAMYWGSTGEFACWYIDLQKPLRRTSDGFVTWDQSLDIVVAPNLTWQWKDQDHLARIQELGWISPEEVNAIQREGECVIRRIENRAKPFSEAWPDWRPDPSWAIPVLPEDWAVVPDSVFA